jgi:hypothetical protein
VVGAAENSLECKFTVDDLADPLIGRLAHIAPLGSATELEKYDARKLVKPNKRAGAHSRRGRTGTQIREVTGAWGLGAQRIDSGTESAGEEGNGKGMLMKRTPREGKARAEESVSQLATSTSGAEAPVITSDFCGS